MITYFTVRPGILTLVRQYWKVSKRAAVENAYRKAGYSKQNEM